MLPSATEWDPVQFIGDEILPIFEKKSLIAKKPIAPSAFVWRDDHYEVIDLISSWSDFSRRGRMAKNMRASSKKKAVRRGSWGVGRFYFRVRTSENKVFDLYYDRAPKDAGDRVGHWYLWRELRPAESP